MSIETDEIEERPARPKRPVLVDSSTACHWCWSIIQARTIFPLCGACLTTWESPVFVAGRKKPNFNRKDISK